MTFKIEIHYRTGDSFQKHDETTELEMEWDDINVVKENIDRIRGHHKYYESLHDYRQRYTKKKPKAPQYVSHNRHYEDLPMISLKLDNGNKVQLWPFWCGFFETFYEAKIKVKY